MKMLRRMLLIREETACYDLAASVNRKNRSTPLPAGNSRAHVDAKGKSMIRTRLGLIAALILAVMPVTAFAAPAQKPGGKPPAGKDDKKGQTPPADTKSDPPPADTKAAEPANSDAKPAEPEKEQGPCDIDPEGDLCQEMKKISETIEEFSKKEVSAQMYAVQQIYVKRKNRLEVNPYWAFTLNDQFVSHPAWGLAANFYITNVFAVGANFNGYFGLNQDSAFNADVRRAARVAVPLTEYDWSAALNFTYVPVYGKFAGFGDFIFHYDLYLVAGVGALSNKPIAIVDPDNRTFESKVKVAFNGGIGLRIFFNRWFALNMELRDYIFNDELENTAVAPNPRDAQNSSTWYSDKGQLTNNVQAQLGVSIFIPFSFDYRLPK